MGLDMYAVIVPVADAVDDFSHEGDGVQMTRWRKHHDLHGWMEALWHRKMDAAEAAAPVRSADDPNAGTFEAFCNVVKRMEEEGRVSPPSKEALKAAADRAANPQMIAFAYKITPAGGTPVEGTAAVEIPDKDKEMLAEAVGRELMLKEAFQEFQASQGVKRRPDFNQQKIRLTKEDLEQLRQDVINYKLPPTQGFFFGDFPPNEESNANDIQFIEMAVKFIDAGYAVYYDSWW